MLGRLCEDVALLAHVASRFLADKRLAEHPQVRLAALHLRKVVFRAVLEVVARRVRPEFAERYQNGQAELDDEQEFGAFYALAGDDADAVDRTVMAVAERAFYRWLEGVCLEESNRAFEVEGSPFDDRAREVLRAVAADGAGPVTRARELRPFLGSIARQKYALILCASIVRVPCVVHCDSSLTGVGGERCNDGNAQIDVHVPATARALGSLGSDVVSMLIQNKSR